MLHFVNSMETVCQLFHVLNGNVDTYKFGVGVVGVF